MKQVPTLSGRRALVLGAARSGVAAAALLRRRGADVRLSDRRPESELDAAARALAAAGMRLEAGSAQESCGDADLVVVSPGVPFYAPAVVEARRRGLPVWPEVELAWRLLEGRLVGITGSNGKTTTTALTAHLLRACGIDAVACGNIGVPLCSLVEEDRPQRWYVAELSSFQLEAIEAFRPDTAVLLNVTADHLDRHADFAAYRAAKERIFRNQTADDHAVLNLDDPLAADTAARLRPRVEWFGLGADPRPAFAVREGGFVLRRAAPGGGPERASRADGRPVGGEEAQPLLPLREFALRGAHNLSNALAALTAAWLCGARPEGLAAGLRTFRPLPHRMEPVGSIGGVEFVNDSKATNVDSALRAVESYDRPLVWILGGRDKGADFAALRGALAGGRVRAVVAMGESRRRIAAALEGFAPLRQAADMEEALRQAREAARPGDVVLLSPACASFDLYRNYEERGDDFRARVRRMAEGDRGGAQAGV
jgi:UDP-N-acetylmuramoylalanine--D-glutamate ligase